MRCFILLVNSYFPLVVEVLKRKSFWKVHHPLTLLCIVINIIIHLLKELKDKYG